MTVTRERQYRHGFDDGLLYKGESCVGIKKYFPLSSFVFYFWGAARARDPSMERIARATYFKRPMPQSSFVLGHLFSLKSQTIAARCTIGTPMTFKSAEEHGK